MSVAGAGTIVVADSEAVRDWQRLDGWRAACSGRSEDDFPLLWTWQRDRIIVLFHQLHGLAEIQGR